MPARFAEFLLEASRDPQLATLCRDGADREGLCAVMDRYGLTEVERSLVLNAAKPADSRPIVKGYRKAENIVKAYRKAADLQV